MNKEGDFLRNKSGKAHKVTGVCVLKPRKTGQERKFLNGSIRNIFKSCYNNLVQ
jgi:hypothetical protein